MTHAVPHYETVLNRLHKADDQKLYHYCNTSSFLAIIETGNLRFSDANMMNDGSEGRYRYALFERAANALLETVADTPALDGLNPDFFHRVDAYLSPKQMRSHPVIACFSKAPDVLSQWRAYAEDGQGWSIGFQAEALSAMPVTLLDVLYEEALQLTEIRNHLAATFLVWKAHGGEFRDAVGQDVALLASWLHAYKDPSFREEQEVRALHELRVDIGSDGLQLVDEGGTADGIEVGGQPVKFRSAGSAIVPYIDIPFRCRKGPSIAEVWYGPRNENGPGNAIYPLTHFGHRSVALRRSGSFYRG